MDNENHLPLSGIKVLELGHAILGLTCGQILADMGAEVIRVERTPDGDSTRNLPIIFTRPFRIPRFNFSPQIPMI